MNEFLSTLHNVYKISSAANYHTSAYFYVSKKLKKDSNNCLDLDFIQNLDKHDTVDRSGVK